MRKFLFMILFISSISAISFGLDYWYLDIELTEFNDRKTGVIQRAYFFLDLATLESATGFPYNTGIPGDENDWDWRELTFGRYSYSATIYSVMLRNDYKAAFILVKSGITNKGRPYYLYDVYFRSNGRLYIDIKYLLEKPVKL